MKRTDFYLHLRSRHGVSYAAVLAGCVLLLAACSADDNTPDMPQAGHPVGFSTNVEGTQTRSEALTTDNLRSMGVFACYTGSRDFTTADTPNFMYNQEVKRSDASSPWAYSPVKYWPNNSADKLSFFAYAPYNAAGVTLSGNTVAGFPYIDYTVPTAEADQIDLLASVPLMNQTYSSNMASPGNLSFTMRHALTKVTIYAKSSDLSAGKVVNSLSITAPKSGTLTYKADGFGWSSFGEKSTYTATNMNVTIATSTADEKVLLGTFYLIPDRANSSLNITYTVTGSISDNVNPPTDNVVITGQAFPDTYDWTPGTSIVYTVNIARTGLEVVAESSSMEWTGSTNEIELYDPAQLKLGDYYYSDGSTSDGGVRIRNMQTEEITLADPLPGPVLTNPETNAARTCIGLVFYVGKHPSDDSEYPNAMNGKVNGYVLSLTNYGEYNGIGAGYTVWATPSYYYLVNTSHDIDDYKGYYNTQQIKNIATSKGDWNENSFVLLYKLLNQYDVDVSNINCSGWYMPSIGQLWDIDKYKVALRKILAKVGNYTLTSKGNSRYWSSTESTAKNAWIMIKFDGETRGARGADVKDLRYGTRPVLTF